MIKATALCQAENILALHGVKLTYIHPLGICNLRWMDGNVGGERSKKTGKVDIVCAPAIAMHVSEAEHGYEL